MSVYVRASSIVGEESVYDYACTYAVCDDDDEDDDDAYAVCDNDDDDDDENPMLCAVFPLPS